MSNLEYHNQMIGRILAHLVNRGLAKTDLKPSDAMKIMEAQPSDEKHVFAVFADCITWMRDEGLIRIENTFVTYSHGTSFLGVQLTSVGLALIKRDTKDPDIGGSIEERVTKSGGGDLGASLYTKIGDFVGGALGGFTKSISGG